MEYALWLSTTWRLVLFLGFLLTLFVLGYQYIVVPLSYLFKLRKGIPEKEASRLIGKHFSTVGDKLVNLLEWSESSEKSDLLSAAIAQRSSELRPLSFTDAINFKDSVRYAKYLLVPLGVIVLVWLSGNIADFFGSYQRVVNYDIAYEPPAPFQFILQNQKLKVLEDNELTLSVRTIGDVAPETVFLEKDGQSMVMQSVGNGVHEMRIEQPISSFNFRFKANAVYSREYRLEATRVPAIVDFNLALEYPEYLGLKNKEVKGTGNVTIPEGTKLTWQMEGMNTSSIQFVTTDTVVGFVRTDNRFEYSKRIYESADYELTTSNEGVINYERLGYRVNVLKDQSPKIRVEEARDSLRPNELYFTGGVSDDHKVSKVRLVYYEVGDRGDKKKMELVQPNKAFAEFYYTFPSGLAIETGKTYEMYFEVTDNDGLRGGKVTRSQVFRTEVFNDKQLEERRLDNQESLINDFDKRLNQFEEQNEELNEINRDQKQEGNLEYKDKERIKQFLDKQKQQESLMEKFSKELKDNLKKEDGDNEMNQLLQERLERQELEAKKNQKLLEQLEKVADKIEREELKKRLEDLAKSQGSSKRNLEQLLELTKRYYVTEKAAQLGQKLEELSLEQMELAQDSVVKESQTEAQKGLNEAFEKISEELDELRGDNRALRKPLELDYSKNEQESIKKDQKEALDKLSEDNGEKDAGESGMKPENNGATQKQNSAAQKMKELSEKLQESMSGEGGSSGVVEDAEMLRQILDNLITFSFKQEGLLDKVNENSAEISEFSNTVRQQKELRQLFEHVDDSLFALSLRRAELSEFVNEQITEVYYNVDKSLEGIADNQMYQAASYQQYVLNASNALADFLANTLDNMQQSMMSGQGQGQGQGFQLPDIIKKQEELQDKMEGGSQSGNEEQQGQGESGKQGDQSGEGEKGEQGENGQSGDGNTQGNGGEGNSGKERRDSGQGEQRDGINGGTGQGMSEAQLKEIYEIYQEQQTLRNALEEQLKNIIDAERRNLGRKLALQMEQFENELLENGITERTLNRMNQIQHELMKLENAALRQGKKKERESKTNKEVYESPILTRPESLHLSSDELEILNRQALPLRPDYQNKVKVYFGSGNQL